MPTQAALKFESLEHIVRVYQERGENLMGDLARPIAESLHAEVLNVFETQGYGKWPGFWWQRKGEPPPGTPRPKYGPARPEGRTKTGAHVPLTSRQVKTRQKKADLAAAEAKRLKKFNKAFGYATGSVGRRYGPKPSTTKRKMAKSYRRWQGNPKLLQDTGVLIGSLTPHTAEDLIEVYTNVPYAKYHVSAAPRHKIPLRDFFDINQAAFERDIIDMINVHIGRPIPSAA